MTGQDGSADHVVGGTGIIINDRSSYNENTDSRNSTPSRVKNVNGYRIQVKARRNCGYRCMHTNVCSLMPKLPEINRIVNQNGIDIISINETHLDDTINDFELLIPGFLLYRRDRNRCGGGVAFYIK